MCVILNCAFSFLALVNGKWFGCIPVLTAGCSFIAVIVYVAKIHADLQQDGLVIPDARIVQGPRLGPGCILFILGVAFCMVAALLVVLNAMTSQAQQHHHVSEPIVDRHADGVATASTENASDSAHSHEPRYLTSTTRHWGCMLKDLTGFAIVACLISASGSARNGWTSCGSVC